MIYLYWYLGIGVVVLALVFGAHRLSKKDESESLRNLLDAANPDRKKISYRLINNVVAPVLAAIAVLIAWPIAIYMKAKELAGKRSATQREDERDFAVEPEHLEEWLSIEQIEIRERVVDPLNAAPAVAFGHLNDAWRKWLGGVGVIDGLWSFKANWTNQWGRKEFRSGYVVVRHHKPGAYFLTVQRDERE